MMSKRFADLPTDVEVSVSVPIPKGLDVVIAVHRQLHGVGAGAVGEGDRFNDLVVEFCPHHDRSGDRTEIVDRS